MININLPKLYDKQLEIAKSCLNFKDDKYIVVNGGRQVGKTFLLIIIGLYWALKEEGSHIMIVSPTDSQVKKIFKQFILLIEPILKTQVKSSKIQSGDSEIQFKNKSVILFRSALSENSLRGYSNTHLLLDECAFIKEDTWNTILAPTLAVRGKKVLFCSTPKGNNFFKRLYYYGIEGKPGYKSFKVTYQENPFANKEFIFEQKTSIPEELFQQEYLGEFIDSTGVFKNIDNYCILHRKEGFESGNEYFQGWDIAFKNDFTVGITFDKDGNMVDMVRFNNVEAPEVKRRIKEYSDKWKPRRVFIENNNQGLPIIQDLYGKVPNLQEFSTTSSSKPLIINQLIAAIAKGEVKLLRDEILQSEFKAFCAELSDTGKVKFAASHGHDDIVMATAIAWECRSKFQYKNTFTIL